MASTRILLVALPRMLEEIVSDLLASQRGVQVAGTVRWRESVAFMASSGVRTFYEVGAGKVLSGLVKRIADSARGIAIGAPADVTAIQAGRQTLDAAI